MKYLEFVEEHTEQKKLAIFEKIMVSVARAKGLCEGRQTQAKDPGRHKPISLALYEVNRDMVQSIITDKPSYSPMSDSTDLDDFEEE